MITRAILIITLIAGVMLSGCIETHTIETYSAPPDRLPLSIPGDLTTYTSGNSITVVFNNISVVLNSDKSTIVNNFNGCWIMTGTKNNVWSCAITRSNDIDYIYLFMNKTAIGYNGNEQYIGKWSK